MSNSIEYPRNCVWYIEARNNKQLSEVCATGSAVALKLKHEGEDPNVYLITCAHVVKSQVKADETFEFGKGKSKRAILCWRPGDGYGIDQSGTSAWPKFENHGIYTASVVDIFARSTDYDWTNQDCEDSKDWVLLRVKEPEFQNEDYCHVSMRESERRNLSIIGFPGGSNAWNATSNVQNKESAGHRIDRKGNTPGIFRIDAGETAGPGMSGGGVFNANGELVGLYRGQDYGHQSKSMIKVSGIIEQLRDKGYTIIPPTKPLPPTRHSKIPTYAGLFASLLLAVLFAVGRWGCNGSNSTPIKELDFAESVGIPLAKALSQTGQIPPLLKVLENQEVIFKVTLNEPNKDDFLKRQYDPQSDPGFPKTVELKINGHFTVIKPRGSTVKVRGQVDSIDNPSGSTQRVEVVVQNGRFIE